MLKKNGVLNSGKRMMIALLLGLMLLLSAQAEMTTEPAAQGPVTDAVQEEGSQLRTGPVLMVTDYVLVEGDKAPGSSFVLQLNIANLSEENSAHNVLATLTIENTSASLQEGFTNQLYFHEILPQQTVAAQYPLEVYSYCTEENMILSMTMTCYDDAAVHYDFQTMMTPDVDVARTLQVSSLAVPQFVHRNSSMIISATLTNAEPVTLSNIKMHVLTQYGEQITEVGQLLKSENKTVDSIYRFPDQKTEDVQVYFTYESLYGHQYATEPKHFEVVVYDPATQSDFAASGMSVMELLENLTRHTELPFVNKQIPVPVFVWILIGCVGYGAVLYRVLRRKGDE